MSSVASFFRNQTEGPDHIEMHLAGDSLDNKVNSVDEAVSLPRAFFVAGARTVVGSLWLVNDDATREVMIRFYKYLLSGKSRAEALSRAESELRRKHPNPAFLALSTLLNKRPLTYLVQKGCNRGWTGIPNLNAK
jgi:hypothetical protein